MGRVALRSLEPKPVLALPTSPVTMTGPDAYRLFSAALLWASTDETRPHLTQVYIEHDGKTAAVAATDGHGMFFCDPAPIESGCTFGFGIATADVRALLRLITDRKEPKHLAPEEVTFKPGAGSCLKVTVGRFGFLCPTIDGFPAYESVVPVDRSKHDSVSVQGAYLAKVARSFPGAAKDAMREIRLQAGGALQPVRFDGLLGTARASVILMPMRSSL